METPTYTTIGKRIPRIDNASKLTGQARFAEDVSLPGGVLHGRVLRSPHPHARIVSIDSRRAEGLPGVRAVVTAGDLPERLIGKCLQDERALAKDTVRFVGDRVAAVAADTPEIAGEALEAITVEYEPLPAVMDAFAALAPGAAVLHPELLQYRVVTAAAPEGGNVCSKNSLSRGDPEAAFGKCARVFEHAYRTEMVHHAYLEPHACLGIYNPDGSYTVHSTTQGSFGLRGLIADALGVPHNRVRLVPTEVGGGFGGKISLQDEVAAAALARKSGRPVRIAMNRREDFLCGTPRSGMHIAIKTGVNAEGELVARTMDIVLDSGAYAHSGVLMSWSLPQFAEGPYRIPNLRIAVRCVYTNKPPCGAFRAPGGPQTNFAIESEMERIAEAMGWDPLEFRRKNVMPEGHVSLAGVELRNVMALETMDAGLELSGYRPSEASPAPNRGRGFALGNWNVGGMASAAVLKLNEDGSASLLTGVVDITGVHTALAQIVAEALDLPMEQVTVQTLDTESAPHSTISAGSQALKSMGDAALRAAHHVREQLFDLAVEALDAAPGRLELVGGQVRVRGEPGRSVAVPALLGKAMNVSGPVVGHGSTGAYKRMPGFGAHVADVEVDPETGQVRLLRYCAAQDVGVAINPVAVEGQIHGAVVQGVGMALSEELIFRDGRMANPNFLDYKIPSATDVPPIEAVLVERPAADGPFGAKGIGEPPIVPVQAAIANAIHAAVGVRVDTLPITPERLRRAIRERGEERNASANR
ncbi:MAG: xanthine dehydrogenase family protein molybdopterin-binding subunit [SAR324 cluster bacterium]|nr:xanthine dehydrogenase family protein molybdopterin-binding subunit [SAR324 cluster bacterium]